MTRHWAGPPRSARLSGERTGGDESPISGLRPASAARFVVIEAMHKVLATRKRSWD
jgi:hypothetical protein